MSINLYSSLKTILNTGKQTMILKAGSVCDCVDDGILSGEADVHCDKCYGTGNVRTKIITEKVRYGSLDIKKDTNLEKQEYERVKNDIQVFYMPFNYDHLNMKDWIATLQHNTKNEIIKPIKPLVYYKILDIKEEIVDSFKFLKVIGEKVKGVTI